MRFKEFIENTFLDQLKKQLGINPKDQYKDPKIASWFSVGDITTNLGSYSIVDYKKNEKGETTHVLIKQINDPKNYSVKYVKDQEIKDQKDKKFLITIKDLEELLLQGQQQPTNQDPSLG